MKADATITALRELYESSALLRIRALDLRPAIAAFSEFARHTEAMRTAERLLYELETSPADGRKPIDL
jgi:hypothetical protein